MDNLFQHVAGRKKNKTRETAKTIVIENHTGSTTLQSSSYVMRLPLLIISLIKPAFECICTLIRNYPQSSQHISTGSFYFVREKL
jgi:hypothetical protein